MKGRGETRDPRENPPTDGIVRHDSHLRRSGAPAGDSTRFALVGGDRANLSATVAPKRVEVSSFYKHGDWQLHSGVLALVIASRGALKLRCFVEKHRTGRQVKVELLHSCVVDLLEHHGTLVDTIGELETTASEQVLSLEEQLRQLKLTDQDVSTTTQDPGRYYPEYRLQISSREGILLSSSPLFSWNIVSLSSSP
ncbi:hypothetical protein PR048_006933 [Dryococelus australis]|uniref:Uncharacterized protein n=1 Tax=Dryococelus australis TaxID=614101 RepID=A0ABQ9ICB9_9NEOP|nr:hypothetical protein PR048_006933 [Dryococelus australis]